MPSVVEERGPGGQYGHGWLAAVIPAEARRFRVADPELATGLASAGAILVTESADVEIAPVDELRDAASFAVVDLGGPQREGSLPLRVASRVATSARVRAAAERARRALLGRGYPFVDVIPWDVSHTFRRPGAPGAGGSGRLAERLPLRALVVARRDAAVRTLLDAALTEAGAATGRQLTPGWSSIRAGILVTSVNGAFLRVAVGPAAGQIAAQLEVLDRLRHHELPPVVDRRVARQLAHGKHAVAEWSLEQRLPGSPAAGQPSAALLADCVEFLVALHSCGDADTPASLAADAELVAAVCDPARAGAIEALARRLEDELQDLPRGFGHGDFFAGNLLVENGRLSGVVDWDAGGAGRLPLLDLLHLRYTAEQRPSDEDWGPGVVDHLLPWARAGGDALSRDYIDRLGLSVGTQTFESVVLAYWLDRLGYQLRTHLHRRRQRRWIARNVHDVLDAVG